MRPVTLNLGVLVRDPVNDNAWPGVDEVIEFNDLTCPAVEDEETSYLVEQVFVVMGYDSNQGDSLPAPAGWQIFSMEEATQLIPGWAAESLEFHAATKITCSNDPDNFYIVGDSFFDVVNAFNTCCGAPNIQSQALALKISNRDLEPGVEYPCGTEATFRAVAIFGNNETRTLVTRLGFVLRNAANSLTLQFSVIPQTDSPPFEPLTETVQVTRAWPADFVGMTTSDGVSTLVNNSATPGPDEYRVNEFDNGTVEVFAEIHEDLGGGSFQVVSQQIGTFALPGTVCGEGCLTPYPAEDTLPAGTVGVAYNQFIQLQGAGPWLFQVIDKPSWMTATLDPMTGQISLTGVPDDHGEDIPFTYSAANCGNELEGQQTLTLDVNQVFSIVSGANFSARNFSESVWVEFLGLFIMWVAADDGSGQCMATSPDGVTWTLRTTPSYTATLTEAAVGTDRVLFIGTGTQGLMTTDGINYTQMTIPEAIQKFGIAYSPSLDLFVMVGQQGSNRIWTTVDGSSWNTIVAPVQNNWSNITWSPELAIFVAVSSNGTGNQVMTSPDGTTWTSQTTPTPTRSFNKVVWLNGAFYAMSQNGTEKLMTSPDGINWSLVNFGQPTFIPTDMAYGNGLYLAATSSGGSVVFMSSENGTSWVTRGSSPNQQWLAVNFAQSLNRFSITGLGPGSGARVATLDWLP